jgi:hypothetical protein
MSSEAPTSVFPRGCPRPRLEQCCVFTADPPCALIQARESEPDAPEIGDVLAVLEYLDDIDALLERRERRAFGQEMLRRRRQLVREMREWLEARVDLAALKAEQPPAPLPLEAVGLLCMVEAEKP